MQTSRKRIKVVICKRPVQDSHKALLCGSLKYIKIHIHSNSHIWLCSLVHYSLTFQLSLISVSRVSIVFTVKDLSECGYPPHDKTFLHSLKCLQSQMMKKIAKEMPSESFIIVEHFLGIVFTESHRD